MGINRGDRKEFMDIISGLTSIASSEGVALLGVAPVERFNGAPAGRHPRNFLEKARNVVVIGIPIPKHQDLRLLIPGWSRFLCA